MLGADSFLKSKTRPKLLHSIRIMDKFPTSREREKKMPPTILSATFEGVVEKPENSGQLRARFSEVTQDIKGVIQTMQLHLPYTEVRSRLLWHMVLPSKPLKEYDHKMIEEYSKASLALETKRTENPKYYTLMNRENDGHDLDSENLAWQKRTIHLSGISPEQFELKDPMSDFNNGLNYPIL
jgi:hypothetical protein